MNDFHRKPAYRIADEIAKLKGPIAVFGAGGFIGSNLFRAISVHREDCFAVTHQTGVPYRIHDIRPDKIVHADVTDKPSLEKIFGLHSFSTIFNLSTYGAFEFQKDPELIYQTNVLGLVNLIGVAEKFKFTAFVQGGSSSEYGLNSQAPLETDALRPNSDYAVSKIAAAYYIQYLGEVKTLPVIHLRYYSIYGPYESPEKLFPVLLNKGLNKQYPPLVNPEVSHDYVYIDDAVAATILAATHGMEKYRGASINIASGIKTTLKEVVDAVKDLCAIPGDPTWGTMPNRNWDSKDWYGNASLAKTALHWQAETLLQEGLAKQLQWLKDFVPAPAQKTEKLSAVIACYKDGQAIPFMYTRLTKMFTDLGVNYEIIFVNDGSPDNSNEVLEQITAQDSHVIAIEHSRNFGSQAALISGSSIATGDAVIWLEGDLQDTPETIPQFYQQWKLGYEVIYGVRDKREGNRILIWFYHQFYRLFKNLSNITIPLDAGDFSFLDRKVITHILALPEKEQFLRGLRAWVGFKQTGVNFYRPERMFGVSTNNWRKNIWWAKKGIFSFTFVPLEILSYAGLVLTLISFLAIVFGIISKILMPEIPHGITTIIVLILFFGGINLLSLSILGEYLGKILEESKGRPKYIRKSIRINGKYLTQPEAMSQLDRK